MQRPCTKDHDHHTYYMGMDVRMYVRIETANGVECGRGDGTTTISSFKQATMAWSNEAHLLDACYGLNDVRQLVFHVHLRWDPRLEVGRVFEGIRDKNSHPTRHLHVDSQRLLGKADGRVRARRKLVREIDRPTTAVCDCNCPLLY